MSVEGRYFSWSMAAGEDLDNNTPGTGHLFKAIALDDGRIATNGREAGGILVYGAKSGEHISIGYAGIMKFTAGAVLTAGTPVTVNGSGYMTGAGSGDHQVGRVLDTAVASGALGTGMFDFSHRDYFDTTSAQRTLYPDEIGFTTVNCQMALAGGLGKAVDLGAGDLAYTGQTFGGVLKTAGNSGSTAYAQVSGIARLRAGGVITADRSLTVNASAHFANADSGDMVIGRALEASAAGNSGSLFNGVLFGHGHLAVNCTHIHY